MNESVQPAAGTVVQFLESVGKRHEAEYYLKLFKSGEREKFAIIVVDAWVAEHALGAVATDLRFLTQLGLFPLVAFCSGASRNAEQAATMLRDRLADVGVATDSIVDVDSAAIRNAVNANRLAVCTFEVGGSVSVSRSGRLAALAECLQTQKIVIVSRAGGLSSPSSPQGGRIATVNMSQEYAAISSCTTWSSTQIGWIQLAKYLLLERLQHRMLISLTSPFDLLRELFTVRGAGTMFYRGSEIERVQGLGNADVRKLCELMHASFGKRVQSDFLQRGESIAYIEKNYRGAALLFDSPYGSYLSKFAVTPRAQGEGLGADLWNALSKAHSALFWRARPRNTTIAWYEKNCDGLVRTSNWHVFWKGIETEYVKGLVEYALAQPDDFSSTQKN